MRVTILYSFSLFVLFVVFVLPLQAQQTQTFPNNHYSSDDYRFDERKKYISETTIEKEIKISFFPVKEKYQEGDNYVFQVTIENQSPNKVFSFRVYSEPFNQFSFSIKKGYQDFSIKKLSYYRFLYDGRQFSKKYRTVSIESSESFSRDVTIDNFFDFDDPGLYEITGEFYPLGLSQTNYRIPIQPFVLRIHSREMYSSKIIKENDVQNSFIKNSSDSGNEGMNKGTTYSFSGNQQRSITPLFPNEVVLDHFERIRNKDYAGYLKNLDLEKLLVNSYSGTEAYLRYESAEVYEKKVIIENFKDFLIKNIDYTIVDSTVLKTLVIDESSVVNAIIAVREPFENYRKSTDPSSGEFKPRWVKEPVNRLFKYYYLTFDLEMTPGFNSKPWKIVSYEVRVISADKYNFYKSQFQSEEEISTTHNQNDRLQRVINFAYNQYNIEKEYIPVLKQLAQFIIANPQLKVELYGHTDILGEEKYNYHLSKKRVESVADLLVSYGVNLNYMKFFYKGESSPITSGTTAKERRLNRRVEINIIYNRS